jgi:hypothetical protein
VTPYRERLLSGGSDMPKYSLKAFLICFTLVAIGAGLICCVWTGAMDGLRVSAVTKFTLHSLGILLIIIGIVYPMPSSWNPAILALCFFLIAVAVGARLLVF